MWIWSPALQKIKSQTIPFPGYCTSHSEVVAQGANDQPRSSAAFVGQHNCKEWISLNFLFCFLLPILTYKNPTLHHLGSIDSGQLKFVFPPWVEIFTSVLINFLIYRSVYPNLPFRLTFLGTMPGFCDPPRCSHRSLLDLDQDWLPLCILTPRAQPKTISRSSLGLKSPFSLAKAELFPTLLCANEEQIGICMAWTLLPAFFWGKRRVSFLRRVPKLGHSPLTATTLLQFVTNIISVLCKACLLLFVFALWLWFIFEWGWPSCSDLWGRKWCSQ